MANNSKSPIWQSYTYLAQTEEARVNKGYLEQTGTLDNRIEGLVYRVESRF